MSADHQSSPPPRVLVFSEGALSLAHGTGTIFARNFSAYPRDRLANWFIHGADPFLPGALDLGPHRWPRSAFASPSVLLAKLWNRCGLRPRWTIPVNRAALHAAVRAQTFVPDLVYAIVVSREGIDSLAAILETLPARIRVVLQIQDFFPASSLGFMRALRRLAPRVVEVWGVSPAILEAVAPHLPDAAQRFDPLCYLDLPAETKTSHRPFSSDFRTLVIGNFWNAELVTDLRAIWRAAQSRLPGLGPIRWHCHPSGIERIRAAGLESGPELAPAPFLSGDALFAGLRAADLALIPFSRSEAPATDYERYSMPSRLTELCPAGLPIFCLTGSGTPIHRYLTTHGIGRCAASAETARAASELTALITDANARAQLGAAARRHAEQHFQLRPFQAWLETKFRELAASC